MNIDEFLKVRDVKSKDQKAREMRIPAGNVVGKHVHDYSHLSILAQGEVIVRAGAKEMYIVAPDIIEIEEHIPHSIEAIKDSVWYCIHNAKNE